MVELYQKSRNDHWSISNKSVWQKFSDHPQAPIFITVIMLLLLFLSTAIIAYRSIRPDDAAVTEVLVESEPTPTSTVNNITTNTEEWTIYNNNEPGFSLKYRPDLTVVFNNEFNYLDLTSGFINNPYENNFNMEIRFKKNDNNMTAQQYFEDRCNNPQLPEFLVTDEVITDCLEKLTEIKEDYLIDGIPGTRALVSDYEQGGIVTAIQYEDELITFYLSGSGEAGDGPSELAIETYDNILSTFEFVDD